MVICLTIQHNFHVDIWKHIFNDCYYRGNSMKSKIDLKGRKLSCSLFPSTHLVRSPDVSLKAWEPDWLKKTFTVLMQIKLHDVFHIKKLFSCHSDSLTFPYCLLSWRFYQNPKNISGVKINANKAHTKKLIKLLLCRRQSLWHSVSLKQSFHFRFLRFFKLQSFQHWLYKIKTSSRFE